MHEEPKKSDAVVWLQGDRYDRGDIVLKLYKSKLASLVIISGNDILIGSKTRPGENNISLAKMKKYLLENGVDKKHIIVDDKSLNTKQQAMNMIELSKQRKWRRLIIVSSAYNQPRAFLTFLKAVQTGGYKVEINNQCVDNGENMIASGRTVTNRKLMVNENTKIRKYQSKGDLASYKEGFNYLKKNVEKNKFRFRMASIEDADFLLKLRNDLETRKSSHNSQKIGKIEHVEWLKTSLKNSNRKIFIVEYKKYLVGTIRLDKKKDIVELSWTVAPEARGQGIGREMVALFASGIKGPIRAEIKVANEASKRIAEYAGMRLGRAKNGILYFSRPADNISTNKIE
jgi:RimJ/RimL family protein N-acetyltransferase